MDRGEKIDGYVEWRAALVGLRAQIERGFPLSESTMAEAMYRLGGLWEACLVESGWIRAVSVLDYVLNDELAPEEFYRGVLTKCEKLDDRWRRAAERLQTLTGGAFSGLRGWDTVLRDMHSKSLAARCLSEEGFGGGTSL